MLDIAPGTQASAITAYVAALETFANNASFPLPNVASLRRAAADFETAAVCAEDAKRRATTPRAVARVNDHLSSYERKFLSPNGLPDRPWYKHTLQAPGFYLGYGATSFPGVVHAIEDADAQGAQDQIIVAASAIADAADYLAELCES